MERNDRELNFNTFRVIITPLYLYSVIFHYIWEMLQMPLYVGMQFKDISSWKACFFATLGDANIVIIIWFAGYLAFKNIWWFKKLSFLKIVLILGIGICITVFIEIHAIKTGRWEYTLLMPIIPLVNVGISPLIQMMILPLLAFYLVKIRANFTYL